MNSIRFLSFSVFFLASIAFANSDADNHKNNYKNELISDSSSTSTVSDQESIRNYWTEERMRAAKPMPIPKISREDLSRIEAEAILERSRRKHQKEKVFVVEPSSGEGLEDSFSASASAEGISEEANVNQRPFWNVGKLYFQTPQGDSYCTAEFVGSNRVLMTAAHCLMDPDTRVWHTSFLFQSRFRNYKSVDYLMTNCKRVSDIWGTDADISKKRPQDYAFLVVQGKSTTGWLGFKTLLPYNNWTAVGYPSNYANGLYLQKVNGHKGGFTDGMVDMVNNPFGEGSSGGAWIADVTIDHVGGNYAIGLNGYGIEGAPLNSHSTMYGPFFDYRFYNLFNLIKKDCNL